MATDVYRGNGLGARANRRLARAYRRVKAAARARLVDASITRLSILTQFLIVMAVLAAATYLASEQRISGEVVATVFGGALGYTGGTAVQRGRNSDGPPRTDTGRVGDDPTDGAMTNGGTQP